MSVKERQRSVTAEAGQLPLSFPCHDNLKRRQRHQDQLYRPCSVVTCNAPDFLIAHWFPKLPVYNCISSRSSILPVVLTMWLELTTNLGKYWHSLDVVVSARVLVIEFCSGRGKIWQELSFCLSGVIVILITHDVIIISVDKCRRTFKRLSKVPLARKAGNGRASFPPLTASPTHTPDIPDRQCWFPT